MIMISALDGGALVTWSRPARSAVLTQADARDRRCGMLTFKAIEGVPNGYARVARGWQFGGPGTVSTRPSESNGAPGAGFSDGTRFSATSRPEACRKQCCKHAAAPRRVPQIHAA